MDVFFVFVRLFVVLNRRRVAHFSFFFYNYLKGRLRRSRVRVCRGAGWCLNGWPTPFCGGCVKKKAIFLQHKWKLGI